MKAFDWQLQKKGYIPMSVQIVDASLVPAPKQRNTGGDREAIKVAQKDVNARGTKSHIAIDRRLGFIREAAVTSASAADGRQLRHLVTTDNTSSEVWADSAYRSQTNEKWLASKMLTSPIHRRKPSGKPLPEANPRANAKKSAIHARIGHVFAHQKNRFGVLRAYAVPPGPRSLRTVRTIGIARAEAKLKLANLAYNFNRLVFHEHRAAMG